MARDERAPPSPAHPRRAQIADLAHRAIADLASASSTPFLPPSRRARRYGTPFGVRCAALGARACAMARTWHRALWGACAQQQPSNHAELAPPRQSHHAAPQLPLPQQKESSQPAPPSLHRPLGAARGRRVGSLVSCALCLVPCVLCLVKGFCRPWTLDHGLLGLSGNTPPRGLCRVCGSLWYMAEPDPRLVGGLVGKTVEMKN